MDSNISIIEGDNLRIQFYSYGKPNPIAIVLKNGSHLATGRNGSVAFNKNSSSRDDEGVYECVARNDVGEDVHCVYVEVKCMF